MLDAFACCVVAEAKRLVLPASDDALVVELDEGAAAPNRFGVVADAGFAPPNVNVGWDGLVGLALAVAAAVPVVAAAPPPAPAIEPNVGNVVVLGATEEEKAFVLAAAGAELACAVAPNVNEGAGADGVDFGAPKVNVLPLVIVAPLVPAVLGALEVALVNSDELEPNTGIVVVVVLLLAVAALAPKLKAGVADCVVVTVLVVAPVLPACVDAGGSLNPPNEPGLPKVVGELMLAAGIVGVLAAVGIVAAPAANENVDVLPGVAVVVTVDVVAGLPNCSTGEGSLAAPLPLPNVDPSVPGAGEKAIKFDVPRLVAIGLLVVCAAPVVFGEAGVPNEKVGVAVLLCPAAVVVVASGLADKENPVLVVVVVATGGGLLTEVVPLLDPNENVSVFAASDGALAVFASFAADVCAAGTATTVSFDVGTAILPSPVSLMGLLINADSPPFVTGVEEEAALTGVDAAESFNVVGAGCFEGPLAGSSFGPSTVSFAGALEPKLNPFLDCGAVAVAREG